MRLRIGLKLLLVIFLTLATFTALSFWTKCGVHEPGGSSQAARVERWRHLQSSVNLRDPQINKRRTASAYGMQLAAGSPTPVVGLPDFMDEMMADFDSADLAENRLGADGEGPSPSPSSSNKLPLSPQGQQSMVEIDCLVNDEYVVPCQKSSSEVYLPFFGFLSKYFEVYGKVTKSRGGQERFEWQHSYSKVYYPRKKYDPRGSFLWFENYNVEVRDRVKCISALDGVPVSTQWNAQGHIYPIQVAQFGLSHFSKNLTEKRPSIVILDDGFTSNKSKWVISGEGGDEVQPDKKTKARKRRNDGLLHFETEGPTSQLSVTLLLDKEVSENFLSLDVLFVGNGSVSCVLGEMGKSKSYVVRYATSEVLLDVRRDGEIVYGIGAAKTFRTLKRDLRVDLLKGLALIRSGKKKATTKLRNVTLRSLEFRGEGAVTNVSLSSSSHEASFFAASDWLVKNQDDKGGWPIMVTRKLSNGILELKPGWYSAMAQGQAMSLLTRAFGVTKNLAYLETALKATKLFGVRSEHHGVMTTFLGKYVWYEEYPTTPSSYVLNGFIYSLIGLYDLKSSCTHVTCKEASRLFEEGMVSLKKMLTLFDTGSGSIYDLRHFSLGIAPNLARWDYHSTHINQLLLLSTIDSDPILSSTALRWIGYMNGKRASHN